MSWEDGSVYEGEVVSVDNYPSNSNMYSGGNPNASYYSFTAYLPAERPPETVAACADRTWYAAPANIS